MVHSDSVKLFGDVTLNSDIFFCRLSLTVFISGVNLASCICMLGCSFREYLLWVQKSTKLRAAFLTNLTVQGVTFLKIQG